MPVGPVNDFTRFAQELKRVAASLDVKAKRATDRVGEGALGTARSVVPVDDGQLRSSLRLRREGTAAVVETDLYYAAFQEYGTSQMAPNPFMGPAMDKWAPELTRALEGVADDVAKELS